MTKEEYGNLLKYLGMLKHCIFKIRYYERDFEFNKEFNKELINAIDLILKDAPVIEENINYN